MNLESNELALATRRAVGLPEVALLIGLREQTLRLYLCKPSLLHLAPPGAFKLPGSSQWRWWLDDVLKWMASGHQAPLPPAPPRRRGRPKNSTVRAMQARRAAAAGAAGGAA